MLGRPVRGIGISSRGRGVYGFGANGEVLANAMSRRMAARRDLERWAASLVAKALSHHRAHRPSDVLPLQAAVGAGSPAGRVAGRPAFLLLRAGAAPARPRGLLLAGPLAGRTMLFDVRARLVYLDPGRRRAPTRSKLARPLASSRVAGTIPGAVARELGLPDGVTAVAGGHDQPCGALGAGVTAPGKAVYGTGTVECICPAFSSPVFSEELFRSNLCTYDFTLEDGHHGGVQPLTGATCWRWFRDEGTRGGGAGGERGRLPTR